jgi:magnesium-transporting ATPase (P-type)
MSIPSQESQPPAWHAESATATLTALASSMEGIDEAEAAARRLKFGLNELPRARPTGIVLIYFRQFASPLIYLLLGAAVVSLLLGKYSDAIFIFAVLQVNALIGTVQEWRAESGIRGLDRMIRSYAVVVRGGNRRRIASEDLVPGDIVLAERGMKVGADIRLLGSSALRVDESLLSGESYPAEKDATVRIPHDAPLGDRLTMLFAGTTVVGGEGHGVVVATGAGTEIGHIAASLAQRPSDPPLVLRLHRFMNRLTLAFAFAVTATIIIELTRGAELQEIFFIAIALAVSAVPEGLPVAVTVALAIGTGRMADEKVIVRRLPAVEGLGACTLIASDKTGTLTCNELTATQVWLPAHGEFTATGVGYQANGVVMHGDRWPDPDQEKALRTLACAAVLCSEGGFRMADGQSSHFGDSVDIAFLVLSSKLGVSPEIPRATYQRLRLVPFSPERRYAASFDLADGRATIHVKGATEAVLPMCADYDRTAVESEERRLAEAGYRVLAVAQGTTEIPLERLDQQPEECLGGLNLLGLVGFIDPLRPEAADAIRRCRSAGIDVRMVTGDHPATALTIARQLGLVVDGASGPGTVITGAEVARHADNPAALAALCATAQVFARVEPVQKLVIVNALQAGGHFVAVTGDGVNDAPALQAADIGVAMGLSGTDVARDAADLVITDDRFASIVSGIREGRIVYDNIRKVVNLLITTGAAEVVLFLLALAAGLPLPLFAVQLLWLNLVTNGIQDVALAFEKGEPDVLARPPRPPSQRILDRTMLTQVFIAGGFMGIASFALFAVMLHRGMPEDDARNLILVLMVLFENVYVFHCRSETRSAFAVPVSANPFVVISVVCALGLHIAVMQVPLMQDVLGIRPMPPPDWLTVVVIAGGLLALMEGYKYLSRRR